MNDVNRMYASQRTIELLQRVKPGSEVPAGFVGIVLASDYDTMRTEIEALRKDAERYRWLREQQWNTSPICAVTRPKDAVKLGHDCPSLDRLDAAIDAAMRDSQ